MTTIDTRPEPAAISRSGSYAGGGVAALAGWITTADHKRVGRLFVGCSLLLGAAVLVVGTLLGLERIDPDGTLLDAGSLDQLFSLYRIALPFMVALPLLLGVAVAVVPLQVGSRGIALGRAAALGFWTWLAGSGLVVAAFIGNGGPGGGDATMVDLFIVSFGLALLGLVIAAGAVATTVLTSRAPGMTLARVPGTAWSALVGSVAVVMTVPVLIGDLALLGVDHKYARTPGFGGNFDLLSWMGWSLTQPATFVLVIVALGITADVVVTASRRRLALRPALLVGVGIFATAALSAVTQKVHLLPWDGSAGDKIADLLPFLLFNWLPILGPVVVLGACAQALASGRPSPASSAGLAFVLPGAGLLTLGVAAHALTGIVDLQLVGSTYEEGVALLVLGGGILVALGGIVHWGPKLWGRVIAVGAVLPLAGLGALGVLLAGVPMLVAGFQNQPAMAAGGYDYDLSPEVLNLLTMIGNAALALTIVGFGALALKSFTTGKPAGDDPWDGQTLEWATTSPPAADNFVEVPRVSSAEPLLDLKPARSEA